MQGITVQQAANTGFQLLPIVVRRTWRKIKEEGFVDVYKELLYGTS